MQRLTPSQARQKIKYYCAYQERSHREVKNKLYGFGLFKNDVEEILSELIKIVYALKEKMVSAYNIKIAMKEIDEDEYEKTLLHLCRTKWNVLKHEQHIVREVKTRNFLLQRGFEHPLIGNAIKEVRGKR